MRMKVDTLTPQEFWETSAEDLEMATAIQHEYHAGRDEVRREREEQQRKAKEREERQRESEARMKAKYG